MPPIATAPKPAAAAVTPPKPATQPAVVSPLPPPPKKTVKRKITEEVEAPLVESKRPVIYPITRAEICAGANALKESDAKALLYWETERDFVARKMVESGWADTAAMVAADWAIKNQNSKSAASNSNAPALTFLYGEVFMLKDEEGNKIRCLHNLDNRPFDEAWSKKALGETLLNFLWAGELTLSEEVEFTYGNSFSAPLEYGGVTYKPGDKIRLRVGTLNGETVRISRTAAVHSGQHQLVGLVVANQLYRAAPRGTYPHWDRLVDSGLVMVDGKPITGPVLETILVTGVSDDSRVIRTIDYTKPRSESDVFYTSELFVRYRDQPGKRKEMSRMLAAELDLLWKRVDRRGYKTHPEALAFVEAHPRMMKALEHLFTENGDKKDDGGGLVGNRLVSSLISAGQAAALCYLMGCSASDGDAYRNGKPPREKGLDWSRWEKAKEFWARIGSHDDFKSVREAIGRLVEGDPEDPDNPGLGGRLTEKLAILAKAWKVYVTEREVFTMLDLEPGGCLHLSYSSPTTVNGKLIPAKLKEDVADFGGIDVPDRQMGNEPPPLSKEEMERRAEKVRQEKTQKIADETAEKVRQMRLGADGRPATPRQVSGPVTEPPRLKGGVG